MVGSFFVVELEFEFGGFGFFEGGVIGFEGKFFGGEESLLALGDVGTVAVGTYDIVNEGVFDAFFFGSPRVEGVFFALGSQGVECK